MPIMNGLLPIATFFPVGCNICATLPEFPSTSKLVCSSPIVSPVSTRNNCYAIAQRSSVNSIALLDAIAGSRDGAFDSRMTVNCSVCS